MRTIEVTKNEARVLETLADQMYAECNFSDVGFTEISDILKDEFKVNELKGIAGSLEKKGYIHIDRREDEGYGKDSTMWIWYLGGGMEGLVKHWVREEDIEKTILNVKS